ncbi:Uncharacterised protein [Burkholderia pseudomallei]|nr:Uncharacterised protein [Burkholderia pseudomallei]
MQADFAARAIARLFSFCAARDGRGGVGEGVGQSMRGRDVRVAPRFASRRSSFDVRDAARGGGRGGASRRCDTGAGLRGGECVF